MIDISRAGLNLKGVLIRGRVEFVEGEEAHNINRAIHLKYVTQEGLSDIDVASYLSKGDDITVMVHMDHLIHWNLADSKAWKALSAGGWSRPLDAQGRDWLAVINLNLAPTPCHLKIPYEQGWNTDWQLGIKFWLDPDNNFDMPIQF